MSWYVSPRDEGSDHSKDIRGREDERDATHST